MKYFVLKLSMKYFVLKFSMKYFVLSMKYFVLKFAISSNGGIIYEINFYYVHK